MAVPKVGRLTLRWLLTGLAVVAVLYFVDIRALSEQVRQFQLWPVFLAMLISALQVVLSAWRWRYTAAKLGLPLPLGGAIREYYLSAFLNQVLPGGVLGDANRAWRHGGSHGSRGAALRAVMIERLSGQVVLAVVAALSLVTLSPFREKVAEFIRNPSDGWEPGLALILGLLILALVPSARRRLRVYAHSLTLPVFAADCRRALFSWPAFGWQWLSSLLVVLTYLGVFLLAARGIGIARPAVELLPLVPLVLLAMLLPIGIAGWGVREGAAALVWGAVGLPPEEGVAIAVSYGVLVLISSLPGALLLPNPWAPGGQRPASRG